MFVALLLNLLVLFCTLDETEKATSFSAALRRAEVEYFLSSLFTFEFAVKVLALGLFGRRGFFTNTARSGCWSCCWWCSAGRR